MSSSVQSSTAASRPRLAMAHAAARPPCSSQRSSIAQSPPLSPPPTTMQNPPKMVHKQHHAQQQQQQQQRRSSPALTRQEIEAAVQDRVKRTAPYIKPGAVVVYEFLDEAQEWHWSLGTVQRANPHVVTLAEWSCEFDGLDKSVMATLGKEEARIRREMEDHQATILALRSELGAVRTHNESEMNAARDAIEERRRGMEATTDALDRCAQRGVALRLNCGIDEDDVLAAVLRAALSIVEDYVPVEPLPWDVIWATVCDPVFLQRCVNYDAGYDMSVEQRDDIVACYVDSQLITEAKVRRAAAQMAMKSPDLNEVLCATASWVFTQLSAFRVYQKCASTQSYADELQQQLTHHVNSLKEGIRKLRQVQAQLRVPSGVPGDPSGTSSTPGADTHYTFVPLEDSTIEVLRCAVICPLPTSSPVQKAASSPALEESTPPSVKGDGSSRSSSAPPLKGSRNGNRTGTAHAHAAPSPSPEVIVLDQEELDEIVSRATQDRPQLLKALDDLQRECGRLERELAFVKSFTKEAAIPPAASLRSATAPSSRASLVERPPSQMAPDAGHNGRPYRIRPSANDDDSDGSDEEADTRALQNVLLGLHRDLQGARRENEQLKRSLEREAHKHKAEAAELGRQLHAVRAEHEDALGRLADAKIHCEALQAENDDLEKSVADLTDRIHAHEKELQNDPGDIRSASKSTKRTDPDEVNATPAPSEVDAVADPDAMLAEGKVPSPGHDAATAQPACVTHHRKHLDGDGWPDAVRHHPDRMQAAVAVDAANACRVLNDAITHVQFSPYGCTAEFDVSHAPEIAQRTLDEKIEQRPFDECARVLCDDEEHRSAKDLLHHLEERDATIRDLEQHLEELKAQLAQLSAADNPVEATKAAEPPSSLPDATALQEELDHARQANAFLQASVDELADKLQAARDENADLVDSNNAVVAELRQQVADTQDQLSDAARCQQSSDAEIADLKQQLEEGGATDPEPPRHVGCDSSFAKEGEDSSHVPLGPQQHPANTTAAALDDPPVGAASVAALQQKLEEEAATNASLQKAMQDAVKDNAELRNIAAAAQIGREAIEAECADLQKKLHDCEAPHSPSARDLGQPAAASISIAEMNKGDTEEVLQQLAAAQQRNAKKDAEIADLRDQLADAEQRAKDAEDAKAAEGSDKDAEIADLRDQLADAEQRAKDAEDAKAAEGSDKDAEIADLRDQLADAEQRAKDAEDAKAAEGSDKDAEIADLRDQLADAEQRAKDAEDAKAAEGSDKDAEIADLRDQLADAEQRAKDAEDAKAAEGSDKDAEIADLRDQLADAEQRAKDAEDAKAAEGSDKDAEIADLRDQLADAEQRAKDAEDAKAAEGSDKDAEIADLRDQLADAEQRAKDAEDAKAAEGSDKDAEIAGLRDQLADAEQRAKDAEDAKAAEGSDKDAEIADLRDQLADAEQRAKDADDAKAAEGSDKDAEIADLRDQLADAEQRAKDAEDAKAAEGSDKDAEIADLRDQLADAEQRAKDADDAKAAEGSDKDAEIADLRDQLADAEQRAKDAEDAKAAEGSDKDAEIADLRDQLADAEQRAKDAEDAKAAEGSDKDAEIADLRDQLADAEQRAKDAEDAKAAEGSDKDAEIADLRDQLADAEQRAKDAEDAKAAEGSDKDAEIADLRDQLADAEQRAKDAEDAKAAEGSDKDAEIAGLRDQLADAEQRAKDAEDAKAAEGSDKDAEIADLRDQLADAEQRAKDADDAKAAEGSDKDAEIADLRDQLADAEQRAKDAEDAKAAEGSDKDAEIADLRDQLADAEQRAKDAEDAKAAEGSDKDAEIADLRDQLADAEQRAKDAEDAKAAEGSDKDAEIADLRDQLADAEQRAKDAEDAKAAEGSDKDAEIADLRDQLADAEQRAKDAEDAKAAEGSDKDAEIADLRDQLADAEQRAKDAEDAKAAEGSDKDAEIADLRDQLADAEQRAKDADDAKAAEGSDKDAEIADLRDQLADAEQRAKGAEDAKAAEGSDKDAEIADLRDQLADAEQRAKDAEDAKAAEGSDKDAEIADLRDQLADAEQRAKDAEDAKAAEGSDKDAEIADLRDQLADAEQRAKDAEDAKAAEGSDKDAEIADLRDQLANAAVRGNVADAYEDRIGALTVELEAMSAECTDTLEKLEECMALLEESRQGEAELRERLMSKEDEVFKLKCQLDFAQKELVESEARMAAQGPAVDPQVLSALEDEVAVLRVDKDELEDAFARRNEEHQLEVDALNDKVDELTAELEDKGEDYANTLEKLEEFVGLLETARASERAALQSLDDTEHELGVQQAQHDDEMAATHRIIDGLRRERNDLQRQLSERVGGASLEPLRGERTEVRSPQSATLGGDEDEGTATSGTLRSAMQATRGSSSTMREQLEQLKREKEALLSELAMRDAD